MLCMSSVTPSCVDTEKYSNTSNNQLVLCMKSSVHSLIAAHSNYDQLYKFNYIIVTMLACELLSNGTNYSL